MRDQHRNRLAEHSGFGFDTADAPAKDTEAVDHRCMRVRADNGVGVGAACTVAVAVKDDPAQVFEVYLVHDTRVWRDDAEILKRRLSPAQEGVSLLVALKLDFVIQVEGVRSTVVVDLHRMIDDQFSGRQRVDPVCGPAELDDGVAHGSQVNNCRYAREVLQDHATRRERNFCIRVGRGIPVRKREDVVTSDVATVFVSQQVFQQYLERVGEFGHMAFCNGVEAKDFEFIATDGQHRTCAEAVLHRVFLRDMFVAKAAGSRSGPLRGGEL